MNTPLQDSTIDEKMRDQRIAEFEKLYLAKGQPYALFRGGEKVGSLRIGKPKGVSCISLTATATLPLHVSLLRTEFAIATSSNAVRSHARNERRPSPDEENKILAFARKVFQKEGITENNLRFTKTQSIVLTDIEGNGTLDVVGTFHLRDKTRDNRLLLVLTSVDDGYRIALKLHTSSTDLEDLTDLSAPEFVGQLDLDGDGVDELIVRNNYYENWDYSIYGKKRGVWRKVYQGGGGGC